MKDTTTQNNTMRRYTVAADKPTKADFTANVVVPGNWGHSTLTSPAPGWILGQQSGELVSYQIPADPTAWTRHPLGSGWSQGHIVTPGGGHYYARTEAGALERFLDTNPTNRSGTDIVRYPSDPVDTSGWNQVLLSAVPWVS